jgi:hypothetical protein
MLLIAQVDVKKDEMEYIWFLDYGCSNHICSRKEVFIEMDGNFRESVKLGYDSSHNVQHKGKVRIEMHRIVHMIT